MKWRQTKIIFRITGSISSIVGIGLIVLSAFNMSLNSTYLGYVGGVVMIMFGGILWLWEMSHKPKWIKQ